MRWAVVPCAVLAVLLIVSGARAEFCELKLENGFVGVWRGPCKEGTPYGKGELTYDGKTYKGVAEDGKNGLMRFSLDKDGRNAGERLGGVRRDRGKPAEDAEAGAPPASAATREKYGFRNYSAGGDNAGGRDRGEPAEAGDAGTSPASAPTRSPETPAPGGAVAGKPVGVDPAAAPCKLEVGGERYDWSGECRDGKARGAGSATTPDGKTYTGSAKDGQRDGFGTVATPDGGYFQGEFRNGVAHGEATFRFDGEYYRARFENGERVGEKTPVDWAAAGGADPDEAERESAGRGNPQSDVWDDDMAVPNNDPWGSDGTGAQAGAGAERADPEYAGAVNELEGGGASRLGAPDDEYVGAIGTLERRNAERRRGAQRERKAARGASKIRERTDAEQAQERGAQRDAARQRRQAALDRAARGTAALNRDRREERARQARTERQRKLKAHWERNLKMAGLQQTLNAAVSRCGSDIARDMRELARCNRPFLVWCASKADGRTRDCPDEESRARDGCRRAVRRDARSRHSRCEAQARSSYRNSMRALLSRNP